MRAKLIVLSLLVLTALVLAPVSFAQCYLSQGCAPQDLLNYGTSNGRVYHGDGASNDNSTRGWTTYYADVNQCLSCHYGTDTMPYLNTGHKNTLRKYAPGVLWGGPDSAAYGILDAFYGSGSTYDWNNGLVTVGWCTPLATIAQNGLPPVDASCTYPYYTLPNEDAPAPYTPVAPTIAAGGVRNLYYIYGGWMNYGGPLNTSATQLNTIFDNGHTGQIYPNGNFDCARCHATGYNFDASGPEPTSNTNNKVTWIPDASLPRIPSNGYIAPGTHGTSSWYLTGVQCERCHVAAWGYGSHPQGGLQATIPHNEAATALCVECHREETIVMASSTNPGAIYPANPLVTLDRGYCSDRSGSPYATCLTNPANQWVYKPFINNEQGPAFLNSPHARLNGNMIQNAQNSPDLSVTISGTYGSQFSESIGDPTKNLGCTGCHDPHQTTVASAPDAKPLVKTCDQCHKLAQTIMSTINHPMGPGTPFPTGLPTDIPGACVTCHMQAALGTAHSHLFRINSNVNYATFPTSSQLYTQNISTPNTAPEVSPLDGTTYSPAIWLDVDLACGQCHVGGDGKTNPYGLTLPPGMPGAHAYTKTQLAYWASTMHPPDPGVPTPTFSPAPGTYHTPQSVAISDSMSGATIYYTLDGTLPTTGSPVYSAPIPISATTSIYAMATYPGYPRSNVVLATYSIVLPTAPSPIFTPPPSTFSGPQSVALSNSANLPMYYTLDGSLPTTGSTPYTTPISVTKNTIISAITAAYGYLNSAPYIGNYNIQAPVPTFSPAAGTYYASQNVVISSTITGATIYYTTNGSAPTTSSTPCPNPCSLTVSATTTLKAIASGGGYASSNVSVAAYTIAASNPLFSPAAGTYYSTQTVTITDTTPGVTIYYALNGFPTTSSPSCTSPCNVSISTTTTLRAMALGNGISQSGTTVGVYTIAAQTPAFSPAGGTFATAQNVTISDTTPGVTIYWAINGFPTTSSSSCTSPCLVAISASSTLRAMAAGTGISQSGTAVGVYTITGH
ncbi:MAG TPA: chitobiase/beta-hexosaminidase C-terminal domain-containing protein [Methylomirabilota bacterium]|nr:chitobiase/beta-hexosaminidase C-terminal domain-containing protein [Methylomirabilota bacterium]